MKWISWNTALCSGIAFTICITGWDTPSSVTAEGFPPPNSQKKTEKDNRGNRAQSGNRGNSPSSSPRNSASSRGGNGPGSSSRGGIHAPSNSQPHQAAGGNTKQPSFNRSPSFSRPSIDHRPNVGSRSGVGRGPAINVRPRGDVGSRDQRGVNTSRNSFGGTLRRGDQGLQNTFGTGGWRHSGNNLSRTVNRLFSGNSFSFSNRNFRLSSNQYRPAYYRHSGYHGYWNNNRGYGYGYGSGYGYGNNYGYNYYGYRPFGWGLGGWGLGSILYNSGYLGYSNPYYVGVNSSVYNYSQPIPVSYSVTTAAAENEADSADQVMSNAVAAFQQNDYDAALDITNQGLSRYSDDAVLHEFRALVLFARGDYQQAAATIHSVLAIGPGWDWTTLSSLYSDVAIYTTQLRALEATTKETPQDAASRFLLAYHYMSCGHTDAAARQLQQVVQLKPNDRVAIDILKMIEPSQPDQPVATPPQPSLQTTRSTVTPVDPTMLVGTWQATRPDGAQFNLILTNDAKFNWSFAQKDQAAQKFGGTYTVEGNVLALEGEQAGSLIAEVTPGSKGANFNFKALGAPDEDPGLNFTK